MTAARMPAPGPAGLNLAANVKRLCAERRLSLNRLSALLEEAGRPIPPLGLSRMLRAARRTDVDDLLTLSTVLGATPDRLLAPPEEASVTPLDHAALAAARQLAGCVEDLLVDRADPEAVKALDRALRRVHREAEELLADIRNGN